MCLSMRCQLWLFQEGFDLIFRSSADRWFGYFCCFCFLKASSNPNGRFPTVAFTSVFQSTRQSISWRPCPLDSLICVTIPHFVPFVYCRRPAVLLIKRIVPFDLSGEFHTVYSKALYFYITHHCSAILTKLIIFS
jgi:hypothetical protein